MTWLSKSLLLMSSIPTVVGMLQVPQWISDGMVLQGSGGGSVLPEIPAVLNGMSDVGKITVRDGQQTYETNTDANGNWTIHLNGSISTVPTTLTITNEGGDSITVNDVLYGDVYFCAGQSNMAFPMMNAINATEEIATIKYFPNFRFFKTPFAAPPTPQSMLKGGSWVNSTASLGTGYLENFSAMCYMTAREITRLQSNLDRPIGLVESAVSGTRVEAWMPKQAFDLCSQYKGKVPTASGGNAATALYNGMVSPFIQMSVRAGIWYQGEHNAKQVDSPGVDKRQYYTCMYSAMIETWRQFKKIGDFPWLTEQLPPSKLTGQSGQLTTGWIPIRLAEADVTHKLTNAGMAVGIDLGGVSAWGSLHPADKNEMSRRMALQGAKIIYNIEKKAVPSLGNYLVAYDSYYSGPVFESASVSSEGVTISFTDPKAAVDLHLADVSEHSVNNTTPCSLCCAKAAPFEVLTAGNWTTVPQASTIVTPGTSTVLLSGYSSVDGVRYANSDFVECALYNSDDLPLGPFVFNFTQ